MTAVRVAARNTAPSPLRRREFRAFFLGTLVSNIGTWLGNVALGAYMLTLTDSSFWVGVVGFGLSLPVSLFALQFGALADRVDRIRLLRNSQVLACGLALVLTILVAFDLADRYSVALISFGLGATVALAIPAMQSLIPQMVPPEEFVDALSLNALTFNIARVVGPVVAAAALVTRGPALAFALNAATFLAFVLFLRTIPRPPFSVAREPARSSIREALVYAWEHRRTRWMLLAIVAMGFTIDPMVTLAPALARSYGLATGGAGWIVASWGGGAILMLVIGRRVIRAVTRNGTGWVGLLMLGTGVALLGAARSIWVAVLAGVIAGVGYIIGNMAFTTRIQEDVPEAFRGRISALWTIAFVSPRALAAVSGGALADVIGPRWATMTLSAVALIAAFLVRRLQPPAAEPSSESARTA